MIRVRFHRQNVISTVFHDVIIYINIYEYIYRVITVRARDDVQSIKTYCRVRAQAVKMTAGGFSRVGGDSTSPVDLVVFVINTSVDFHRMPPQPPACS